MNGALAAPLEQLAPPTEQLRAVLARRLDSCARIVDIERAPCVYGSSWRLEDITVHLDDGSQIALVFKDLSREAKGSGARRIKPTFVTDPAREPWVYRTLLPTAAPGPPELIASVTDFGAGPALANLGTPPPGGCARAQKHNRAGQHWLLLERVSGTPLTQIGDRDAWCSAARWLGHFHATAPVPHPIGPLLRHDREYHQGWLARALSAAQDGARMSAVGREKRMRLAALAPMHERATQEALATSPVLIHGEFYPSNVLAEESGPSWKIHPVDWEMAALGPPLLDLAALMSGNWHPDDRLAMATAYREGARAAGAAVLLLPSADARRRRAPRCERRPDALCSDIDELLRGVAACRLLLAIQWLGWAAGWEAPADHRNDWLEEAERCAEELRR